VKAIEPLLNGSAARSDPHGRDAGESRHYRAQATWPLATEDPIDGDFQARLLLVCEARTLQCLTGLIARLPESLARNRVLNASDRCHLRQSRTRQVVDSAHPRLEPRRSSKLIGMVGAACKGWTTPIEVDSQPGGKPGSNSPHPGPITPVRSPQRPNQAPRRHQAWLQA
jgi:hypothetical protein